MISPRHASRALPIITAAGILGSAALRHDARAADTARTGGIAALAARTPVLAATSAPQAAKWAPGDPVIQACVAANVDSCFEAGNSRLVNVGAFFDRRRPSASTHFMLKYFEPPATGRYRIEGFSFTSNRTVTFPSCGTVRTSRAAPTFPSESELTHLQRLFVASTANQPTCVDLAAAGIVLEENEAAWIAIQFPDPADTTFIGVRVDGGAVDHPCDFLTRDRGAFWFRPDPNQSPLDWAFTVHYAAQTGKQQRRMSWSAIKELSR